MISVTWYFFPLFRRVFHVMFDHVTFPVTLIDELFATDSACVRPRSCVLAGMNFKRILPAKRKSTFGTPEGLFPCMCAHVVSKVLAYFESSVAHITFERTIFASGGINWKKKTETLYTHRSKLVWYNQNWVQRKLFEKLEFSASKLMLLICCFTSTVNI